MLKPRCGITQRGFLLPYTTKEYQVPFPRLSPAAWCYFLFGVVLLALSAAADKLNPWLQFSTELIQNGEYWRIYTAHLGHLNVFHGLMNVLGFWACCYFFADVYRLRYFAIWLLLGAPAVSAAMLCFDPPLPHYLGLSGLLYGWLMFAIVAGFRTQPWLHGLGFVVLAGRIGWEQTPGYNTGYLLDNIGGLVYVNAHLYGAMFGLIMGLIVLSFGLRKQQAYA